MAENETLTDEQIDNLVERSENASNRDIPMEAPKDAAPAPEEAKATEPPKEDPNKYLEFTHNGKKIRGTVDQVIKWAQQGYDYPQRMNALKQAQTKWEQDRSQWESRFKPYVDIDTWARNNPDKWAAVQQAYQQQTSQSQVQIDPNNPLFKELQAVKQQLAQVTPIAQEFVSEKEQMRIEKEDQTLDNEIKSLRETYKDIDFDAVDENGKSLEYKILEHGTENGIKSFKTAFRDFYHDQLIQRAESTAKQAVAKGIQKNTKLGVLGRSPTPTKTGFSQSRNIKEQSYEELAREALAELKAGAS